MATKKRDYYKVLGVGRNASGDEVKRAYRELALSFRAELRNLSLFSVLCPDYEQEHEHDGLRNPRSI
jgi:preprotein translocase subunit Sec63